MADSSQFKTGLMVGAGISACCFAASSQGSAFTAAPGMGNLRATNAVDAEGSRRLSAAPVEHGQSADQASAWTQATPLLALGAVAAASTVGIGVRTEKANTEQESCSSNPGSHQATRC